EVHFASLVEPPCGSSSFGLAGYTNNGGGTGVRVSDNPSGYSRFYSIAPYNSSMTGWHLMQHWYKASTAGQYDGQLVTRWDNQVTFNRSDVYFNDVPGAHWNRILLGMYFAFDSVGCPVPDQSPVYHWWDDVYLSNTQARVELGNADTWSACTVREIQIPTAWSTTSISATVNTGAFADGGAWLYVVNGNGVVSTSGYPIEVANSPALQYAAFTSATVNMSGGKMQAKNMQLPNGAIGTVTVRYMNNVTNAQIGTTKTAGPGNLLTVAGVTVANGTEVRIEYTLTTTTAGYVDVTTWTPIAVMEMADGTGDVPVVPSNPQ
ncbi:MAG: hypothetical protein Q8N51_05385, partial [Gammaproteobacteria bacterium]|nr:hypothetical protein [Gammaproteobacteria bacterium]